MNNLIILAWYTIRDLIRQKSFLILLGVSIVFVLLIRGCYDGNYSVNGQKVNNVEVAWHASKIVFQVIACGVFLIAALLSMRIFSRDKEDGSLVMFLSRPVKRWHYVCGRVLGTWVLSSLFMFILHLTIFFIAWVKTGGIIPGYMTASLVCSINVLFTVSTVCLLSLVTADFMAALGVIGILVTGFISDGIYLLMQSKMVQSAIAQDGEKAPALWRIIYPKVAMLQQYAVSLIDKSEFHGMGPLHPAVNVLLFTVLTLCLLIACFNKKEI